MPDHSFGSWVKRRRKALDLTQDELARRVGCSHSLIFKIESDERRPSRQIAELLAGHLQIPADQRDLFLKVARQERHPGHLEVISTQSAFEPAAIPQHARSNLPLSPHPILGREFELGEVGRLIVDPQCRLLTLTGPGGIGKTRLSLEAGRRLQGMFPDGVYFVALVGVDSPDHMVPAIAEAIGFTFSSSTEARAQLLNYLRQKELLLLLDNMEHLLDGADLLGEILQRADQVTLLATSREPLHLQAEWTFNVQGLPVPSDSEPETFHSNSAIALFIQRATQVDAGFSPGLDDLAAITRICQLVEGLPLGIELAAPWVRTLSCREIADEIGRSLDFLATATRDMGERHRSMTVVLDHSWELLSTREREVMKRLSVFRGGFTRDAAEHVAGVTLLLLSTLIDKSLIRHSATGRYDLHELTRQYALMQLIRTGEVEEARNQHLRFFMTLLEETKRNAYGREQILWLDRLEDDLDNLRAALEWSLRYQGTEATISEDHIHQAARDSLRFPALLHFFWKRRSHWTEGRQWLRRALAQSASLADLPERVEALNAAAQLAVEQTDTGTASGLAEENLKLSQGMGDRYHIAQALHTLGLVRWKQKQYVEARTLCENGLALFRELGDITAVADSTHSLGHITINQGDLKSAQAYLEESLSLSQELENEIGYVEAVGDLGLLAYLRGDFARAQSYLEDSLARFRAAKLLPGTVSALNRLGDVLRCQDDYEKADRLYTEALLLYRDMGDLDELPSILHNMGYIAQQRCDYLQAMNLFKEALSIQQKTDNRAGMAECLMGIASVLSAQGREKDAARLLGAAESQRESVGASLWPVNQIEYDRMMARLKSSLDEAELAAALAAGQALTLEQVIAEAWEKA